MRPETSGQTFELTVKLRDEAQQGLQHLARSVLDVHSTLQKVLSLGDLRATINGATADMENLARKSRSTIGAVLAEHVTQAQQLRDTFSKIQIPGFSPQDIQRTLEAAKARQTAAQAAKDQADAERRITELQREQAALAEQMTRAADALNRRVGFRPAGSGQFVAPGGFLEQGRIGLAQMEQELAGLRTVVAADAPGARALRFGVPVSGGLQTGTAGMPFSLASIPPAIAPGYAELVRRGTVRDVRQMFGSVLQLGAPDAVGPLRDATQGALLGAEVGAVGGMGAGLAVAGVAIATAAMVAYGMAVQKAATDQAQLNTALKGLDAGSLRSQLQSIASDLELIEQRSGSALGSVINWFQKTWTQITGAKEELARFIERAAALGKVFPQTEGLASSARASLAGIEGARTLVDARRGAQEFRTGLAATPAELLAGAEAERGLIAESFGLQLAELGPQGAQLQAERNAQRAQLSDLRNRLVPGTTDTRAAAAEIRARADQLERMGARPDAARLRREADALERGGGDLASARTAIDGLMESADTEYAARAGALGPRGRALSIQMQTALEQNRVTRARAASAMTVEQARAREEAAVFGEGMPYETLGGRIGAANALAGVTRAATARELIDATLAGRDGGIGAFAVGGAVAERYRSGATEEADLPIIREAIAAHQRLVEVKRELAAATLIEVDATGKHVTVLQANVGTLNELIRRGEHALQLFHAQQDLAGVRVGSAVQAGEITPEAGGVQAALLAERGVTARAASLQARFATLEKYIGEGGEGLPQSEREKYVAESQQLVRELELVSIAAESAGLRVRDAIRAVTEREDGFAGLKAGIRDVVQEFDRMGDHVRNVFRTAAHESARTMTDVLFDALENKSRSTAQIIASAMRNVTRTAVQGGFEQIIGSGARALGFGGSSMPGIAAVGVPGVLATGGALLAPASAAAGVITGAGGGSTLLNVTTASMSEVEALSAQGYRFLTTTAGQTLAVAPGVGGAATPGGAATYGGVFGPVREFLNSTILPRPVPGASVGTVDSMGGEMVPQTTGILNSLTWGDAAGSTLALATAGLALYGAYRSGSPITGGITGAITGALAGAKLAAAFGAADATAGLIGAAVGLIAGAALGALGGDGTASLERRGRRSSTANAFLQQLAAAVDHAASAGKSRLDSLSTKLRQAGEAADAAVKKTTDGLNKAIAAGNAALVAIAAGKLPATGTTAVHEFDNALSADLDEAIRVYDELLAETEPQPVVAFRGRQDARRAAAAAAEAAEARRRAAELSAAGPRGDAGDGGTGPSGAGTGSATTAPSETGIGVVDAALGLLGITTLGLTPSTVGLAIAALSVVSAMTGTPNPAALLSAAVALGTLGLNMTGNLTAAQAAQAIAQNPDEMNTDVLEAGIAAMSQGVAIAAQMANVLTNNGINSFGFFSDPEGVFGVPGGFVSQAVSNTTNFGARGGDDPDGGPSSAPGTPGAPGPGADAGQAP